MTISIIVWQMGHLILYHFKIKEYVCFNNLNTLIILNTYSLRVHSSTIDLSEEQDDQFPVLCRV